MNERLKKPPSWPCGFAWNQVGIRNQFQTCGVFSSEQQLILQIPRIDVVGNRV